MMKFAKTIIFFALLTPHYSQAELNGFFKLNFFNTENPYQQTRRNDVNQVNRISNLYTMRQNISFEFSYELIQIFSSNSMPSIKKNYRIIQFESPVIELKKQYSLLSNLDRLSINWEAENFSLIIGRQPLSFGSGRAVNPTDVFSPFSFMAIDTEERNGVDALRLRMQVGEMSQWDIGILFGKNFAQAESAIYSQINLSLEHFEIRPMLAYFKQATLLGLDVATSIQGASLWFESALVTPLDLPAYFRYVLGADRQIHQKISLFIEYHYNGAGTMAVGDYSKKQSDFAGIKGGVFLSGKNYFDLGLAYSLSALLNMGFVIKHNINDDSTFIALNIEWNAYEDFYWNIGSFVGFNTGSNATSEFAALNETLYSQLRYYF